MYKLCINVRKYSTVISCVCKAREPYSAIYDCWECQIIKNICTVPPCISISILPLALFIKTVHLTEMKWSRKKQNQWQDFLKASKLVVRYISISILVIKYLEWKIRVGELYFNTPKCLSYRQVETVEKLLKCD